MAHQHSPAFLKIVQDAKSRVKELTVDDVNTKVDRGEKFHLVDVRDVRGRPNPATDGRLKTSHFERTRIRHLRLPTAPALWEACDGESAQNGIDRNSSPLTRTGVVAAPHCP